MPPRSARCRRRVRPRRPRCSGRREAQHVGVADVHACRRRCGSRGAHSPSAPVRWWSCRSPIRRSARAPRRARSGTKRRRRWAFRRRRRRARTHAQLADDDDGAHQCVLPVGRRCGPAGCRSPDSRRWSAWRSPAPARCTDAPPIGQRARGSRAPASPSPPSGGCMPRPRKLRLASSRTRVDEAQAHVGQQRARRCWAGSRARMM
mgnify:CR=1 FL=1